LDSQPEQATWLSFLPRDQLGVGRGDGTLLFWDVRNRQSVRTLRTHSGRVHGVAFHPRGEQFATEGDDQIVRVWDAAGELLAELPGSVGCRIAYSPDGEYLAVGGASSQVEVWLVRDLHKDGKAAPAAILSVGGHGCASLAFAPDSRQLACAALDEGQITRWDLSAEPASGR
jgi:WD40 repeat protein